MDAYVYFVEKAQADLYERIKKAQELNATTLTAVGKVLEEGYAEVKSPIQAIERSFDITSKLLDVQKSYALKAAELFTASN